MTDSTHQASPSAAVQGECHTQLLLLPDGRVLAHNLTPAMARVLQKLVPNDPDLLQRTSPDPADGSNTAGSTALTGQNHS